MIKESIASSKLFLDIKENTLINLFYNMIFICLHFLLTAQKNHANIFIEEG